jgi:hypothetical protein
MRTISTQNYTIELNGDSVYFEHDRLGDEKAARLRFEFRRLVDCSGVSIIPREVVDALKAEGYLCRFDESPFSLNLS